MEDLEARLARIERRLDALESRPASVPRSPVPPVYYAASVTEPREEEPSSVDLETLLASRWLPRAGALAIVAAIAYLVALGLERGLITPAMVVLGIAIACFGVVALGIRLKDERAAFGHVLVGLGVGGLYVDAVGAHLYQNVIGSEAMVGSCLAISLAALAYGYVRALPAFLGIGLSGGLLAALMPLTRGGVSTAAGLLLLVSVPAFATAAGRRWSLAVVWTWIATFLSVVPILLASGPVAVRLMPLDAVLLIALAAWTVSSASFPKIDAQGAFPVAISIVTGIAALVVFPHVDGALHLLGLGAAVASVGLVFRQRETGRIVIWSGLGIATSIAPFGLTGHAIDLTLALVALAGAALAAKTKQGSLLVTVQCGLALAAYVTAELTNSGLDKTSEAGLIALLLLTTLATALVVNWNEGRVTAGLVYWALITRLSILLLGIPTSACVTVAWIVVFAGLFIVGFVFRRAELRQLGLLVAALTAAKVVLLDLVGLDPILKAAILLALGIVLLIGGYAYVRSGRAKGNLGA